MLSWFKNNKSLFTKKNLGTAYLPTIVGSTIGSAIFKFVGADLPSGLGDAITKAAGTVWYAIANVVYLISSSLFNLISTILNSVIHYSLENRLIDMGMVTASWGFVRDVANLSLIFILMYISVMTVLGLNGSNTLKMLMKVILVGLFMNFSLVFSEVIIDVSNIVALQFMASIENNSGPDGIGGSIANILKLKNLMPTPQNAVSSSVTEQDKNRNKFNDGITLIGISIFLILTAFTIGAGAGIFLVRIVKLMAAMIFAPFAFAGIILPQTSKYSDQWWGELLSNAFIAPMYLFMLWISLNIIQAVGMPDIAYSTVVNQIAGFEPITAAETTVRLILDFVLAIGLLSSASVVAAKINTETASLGQKIAGWTFGGAAAGAAYLGRNSLGRLAQNYSESVPQNSENRTPIQGVLKGVADYTKESSFDIRQATGPVAQFGGSAAVTSVAGKAFSGGSNEFKANVGGYAADLAKKEKEEEAERKTKRAEERFVATRAAKENLKNKNRTDEQIRADLKTLTNDEVLEMVGTNTTDPTKQHILKNLNYSQIKTLNEKGNLDDNNKASLKRLIVANQTNNADAYKYYAEEDMVSKFKARVGALNANSSVDDVQNALRELKQPKLITSVVPEIMGNQAIMSQLSMQHIRALTEENKSGNGKVTDDHLVAIREVNPTAERYFNSGPMRDFLPPRQQPQQQAAQQADRTAELRARAIPPEQFRQAVQAEQNRIRSLETETSTQPAPTLQAPAGPAPDQTRLRVSRSALPQPQPPLTNETAPTPAPAPLISTSAIPTQQAPTPPRAIPPRPAQAPESVSTESAVAPVIAVTGGLRFTTNQAPEPAPVSTPTVESTPAPQPSRAPTKSAEKLTSTQSTTSQPATQPSQNPEVASTSSTSTSTSAPLENKIPPAPTLTPSQSSAPQIPAQAPQTTTPEATRPATPPATPSTEPMKTTPSTQATNKPAGIDELTPGFTRHLDSSPLTPEQQLERDNELRARATKPEKEQGPVIAVPGGLRYPASGSTPHEPIQPPIDSNKTDLT